MTTPSERWLIAAENHTNIQNVEAPLVAAFEIAEETPLHIVINNLSRDLDTFLSKLVKVFSDQTCEDSLPYLQMTIAKFFTATPGLIEGFIEKIIALEETNKILPWLLNISIGVTRGVVLKKPQWLIYSSYFREILFQENVRQRAGHVNLVTDSNGQSIIASAGVSEQLELKNTEAEKSLRKVDDAKKQLQAEQQVSGNLFYDINGDVLLLTPVVDAKVEITILRNHAFSNHDAESEQLYTAWLEKAYVDCPVTRSFYRPTDDQVKNLLEMVDFRTLPAVFTQAQQRLLEYLDFLATRTNLNKICDWNSVFVDSSHMLNITIRRLLLHITAQFDDVLKAPPRGVAATISNIIIKEIDDIVAEILISQLHEYRNAVWALTCYLQSTDTENTDAGYYISRQTLLMTDKQDPEPGIVQSQNALAVDATVITYPGSSSCITGQQIYVTSNISLDPNTVQMKAGLSGERLYVFDSAANPTTSPRVFFNRNKKASDEIEGFVDVSKNFFWPLLINASEMSEESNALQKDATNLTKLALLKTLAKQAGYFPSELRAMFQVIDSLFSKLYQEYLIDEAEDFLLFKKDERTVQDYLSNNSPYLREIYVLVKTELVNSNIATFTFQQLCVRVLLRMFHEDSISKNLPLAESLIIFLNQSPIIETTFEGYKEISRHQALFYYLQENHDNLTNLLPDSHPIRKFFSDLSAFAKGERSEPLAKVEQDLDDTYDEEVLLERASSSFQGFNLIARQEIIDVGAEKLRLARALVAITKNEETVNYDFAPALKTEIESYLSTHAKNESLPHYGCLGEFLAATHVAAPNASQYKFAFFELICKMRSNAELTIHELISAFKTANPLMLEKIFYKGSILSSDPASSDAAKLFKSILTGYFGIKLDKSIERSFFAEKRGDDWDRTENSLFEALKEACRNNPTNPHIRQRLMQELKGRRLRQQISGTDTSDEELAISEARTEASSTRVNRQYFSFFLLDEFTQNGVINVAQLFKFFDEQNLTEVAEASFLQRVLYDLLGSAPQYELGSESLLDDLKQYIFSKKPADGEHNVEIKLKWQSLIRISLFVNQELALKIIEQDPSVFYVLTDLDQTILLKTWVTDSENDVCKQIINKLESLANNKLGIFNTSATLPSADLLSRPTLTHRSDGPVILRIPPPPPPPPPPPQSPSLADQLNVMSKIVSQANLAPYRAVGLITLYLNNKKGRLALLPWQTRSTIKHDFFESLRAAIVSHPEVFSLTWLYTRLGSLEQKDKQALFQGENAEKLWYELIALAETHVDSLRNRDPHAAVDLNILLQIQQQLRENERIGQLQETVNQCINTAEDPAAEKLDVTGHAIKTFTAHDAFYIAQLDRDNNRASFVNGRHQMCSLHADALIYAQECWQAIYDRLPASQRDDFPFAGLTAEIDTVIKEKVLAVGTARVTDNSEQNIVRLNNQLSVFLTEQKSQIRKHYLERLQSLEGVNADDVLKSVPLNLTGAVTHLYKIDDVDEYSTVLQIVTPSQAQQGAFRLKRFSLANGDVKKSIATEMCLPLKHGPNPVPGARLSTVLRECYRDMRSGDLALDPAAFVFSLRFPAGVPGMDTHFFVHAVHKFNRQLLGQLSEESSTAGINFLSNNFCYLQTFSSINEAVDASDETLLATMAMINILYNARNYLPPAWRVDVEEAYTGIYSNYKNYLLLAQTDDSLHECTFAQNIQKTHEWLKQRTQQFIADLKSNTTEILPVSLEDFDLKVMVTRVLMNLYSTSRYRLNQYAELLQSLSAYVDPHVVIAGKPTTFGHCLATMELVQMRVSDQILFNVFNALTKAANESSSQSFAELLQEFEKTKGTRYCPNNNPEIIHKAELKAPDTRNSWSQVPQQQLADLSLSVIEQLRATHDAMNHAAARAVIPMPGSS